MNEETFLQALKVYRNIANSVTLALRVETDNQQDTSGPYVNSQGMFRNPLLFWWFMLSHKSTSLDFQPKSFEPWDWHLYQHYLWENLPAFLRSAVSLTPRSSWCPLKGPEWQTGCLHPGSGPSTQTGEDHCRSSPSSTSCSPVKADFSLLFFQQYIRQAFIQLAHCCWIIPLNFLIFLKIPCLYLLTNYTHLVYHTQRIKEHWIGLTHFNSENRKIFSF